MAKLLCDLNLNLDQTEQEISEPDWQSPRVAISIGLNARMQSIEIMNTKVANPHVIDWYNECCIEDELEFDEEPGIYIAEWNTIYTSYDSQDGREYDSDPDVKLLFKYNFATSKWDDLNV